VAEDNYIENNSNQYETKERKRNVTKCSIEWVTFQAIFKPVQTTNSQDLPFLTAASV